MKKKKLKKLTKGVKRTVEGILPLLILCAGFRMVNSRLDLYFFRYIDVSEWGAPDL